jgi:uncharacterized protein involved in exopolysaccharide biosynthesis
LVRLLEVAFRRWWVVVLPLVAFSAVGVYLSLGGSEKYESAAVLRVQDETVLSDLTGQTSSFTWETPAQVTSRRLNEMLSTDSFTAAVATAAGVDDASVPGLTTLADVRSAVGASASGENLVVVRAQTADPEASQRLTQATIDEFVQTVIDSVLAESAAAEAYFTELLTRYEAESEAAASALESYLISHPEPAAGDRPTAEQVEIARLNRAADAAELKVQGARQNLEQAQLAAEQALADTQQRLSVIDEPEVAVAPLSSMKEQATTIAMFVLLGLFFAAAGLVVLMLMDRTLRRPEEVRSRLGVDVIGTVPQSPWIDAEEVLGSWGPDPSERTVARSAAEART